MGRVIFADLRDRFFGCGEMGIWFLCFSVCVGYLLKQPWHPFQPNLLLPRHRPSSLSMMPKLAHSASRKQRCLNCHQKITLVIEGRTLKDGIMQDDIAA